MRTTTTSLPKLSHREPIPRGLFPKLRHLGKDLPKPGILLPVCVLSGVLLFPLQQFLTNAEFFQVQYWDVDGLERLSDTEIRWLMGADEESIHNIFGFDEKIAVQNLENHPAVLRADVVKVYPNEVDVVIFEREPEAVLVTRDEAYLVDAQGVIFCRARSEDLLQSDYPFFTQPSSQGLKLGDRLDEDFTRLAFLYYETIKASTRPISLEISEYAYDPGRGLTLILRDGARLYCGDQHPADVLPRYEALRQKLDPRVHFDYVDLRLESHIPYKLN